MFCIATLVLISKYKLGEYRGIALLDTITKLVSSTINRRLAAALRVEDEIHGFRSGEGKITAVI